MEKKKNNLVPIDKSIVILNGLIPAAWLFWKLKRFYIADPRDYVLQQTGVLALIFLVLTLTITPLRKLTGWNYLSHFRRLLGLFTFFYAVAHFVTYFFFIKDGNVSQVVDDIVERNFILLGMAALLLMIPLALTSTGGMIRVLGANRWRRLHQLIYAIAPIVGIHYYLATQHDKIKPTIVLCIFGALLLLRAVQAAAGARRVPRETPSQPEPAVSAPSVTASAAE